MQIREAKYEDIDTLVSMGEKFFQHTPFDVPYDRDSIYGMLEFLINSPDGCVFVSDDLSGMIGGLCVPLFFNNAYFSANEMFWWVNPESRGTGNYLLRAFEDWAKDKGASYVQMTHLTTSMPESLAHFYTKKGFWPVETNYMREV